MQQINLYQAQFQPKKILLPPRQMLLILAITIAILSIFSLYSAQRNSILEKTVAQQQQRTVNNIETLADNPILDSELERLLQQQLEKQALLSYLTHQDFGNQKGFSNTLLTFSNQKINNVWLTRFSLLNGGQEITLQGEAVQSSQIPLYIDSLGESAHFHGKQFSVFQLQQPADNAKYYTFKLHSGKKRMGGIK